MKDESVDEIVKRTIMELSSGITAHQTTLFDYANSIYNHMNYLLGENHPITQAIKKGDYFVAKDGGKGRREKGPFHKNADHVMVVSTEKDGDYVLFSDIKPNVNDGDKKLLSIKKDFEKLKVFKHCKKIGITVAYRPKKTNGILQMKRVFGILGIMGLAGLLSYIFKPNEHQQKTLLNENYVLQITTKITPKKAIHFLKNKFPKEEIRGKAINDSIFNYTIGPCNKKELIKFSEYAKNHKNAIVTAYINE